MLSKPFTTSPTSSPTFSYHYKSASKDSIPTHHNGHDDHDGAFPEKARVTQRFRTLSKSDGRHCKPSTSGIATSDTILSRPLPLPLLSAAPPATVVILTPFLPTRVRYSYLQPQRQSQGVPLKYCPVRSPQSRVSLTELLAVLLEALCG